MSLPILEVLESQITLHDDLQAHSDPLSLAKVKKPRRKLTKLERELGLGSSRFIVGAKNFISPDQRDTSYRRRSQRISDASDMREQMKTVFHAIATPRRTRTVKITKKTIVNGPATRKVPDRVVDATPSPKPARSRRGRKPKTVKSAPSKGKKRDADTAPAAEMTFCQLELPSDPIQFSSSYSRGGQGGT